MFEYLLANWKTVAVVIVLLIIVALAIRKIIADRKKGIGPCGKCCAECSCGCEYNKKAGS